MGNSVDIGNVIVGFGGVFILGVIGVVVHWYLGRLDERDAQNDDQTSSEGAAHRSNA